MSDFRIHTLGCGSAKPSLRHQPSSTVVEHNGNLYMIDCGEGAQLAFQRKRLKFSRLAHIFLTHLHGDHVFGLPGLVGTLALSGIGGSLTIHTFEEGRKIISQILGYFNRDCPIEINYNVIRPEEKIIFETKTLSVRTLPLDHRVPDVGFVFEEKERPRHINREMTDFHGVPLSELRSIQNGADFTRPDGRVIPNELLTTPPTPSKRYAHMSDTAFIPGLGKRLGPVDLLFHETTYLSDREADAKERGHSTARQAGLVAAEAGAKHLLTGHYSSRYKDDSLFADEARTIFPDVICNREGLTVEV